MEWTYICIIVVFNVNFGQFYLNLVFGASFEIDILI